MSEPRKQEIGKFFNGRSHPIWCYDHVPDGMRRARLEDMYPCRQFLYKCQLGPDKGLYYTGYYVGTDIEPIRSYIQRGIPVYVKD